MSLRLASSILMASFFVWKWNDYLEMRSIDSERSIDFYVSLGNEHYTQIYEGNGTYLFTLTDF